MNKLWVKRLHWLGALAWLFAPAAVPENTFSSWAWDGSRLQGAPDTPLCVGSLQKPFVVKAWAECHGVADLPKFKCTARALCWAPAGHGDMDLVKATALSCNAYFRLLAEQTPSQLIRKHFAQAGFDQVPTTTEEAIGLSSGEAPRIRPARLLEAYRKLITEPWISGEPVRQVLLAGLREAALTGTAKGIGRRGFWAKTGTVPSMRRSGKTCGLAITVDDAGMACLAKLDPGQGREAAKQLFGLGGAVGGIGPVSAGQNRDMVRVQLFPLLGHRHWRVKNLGGEPVPANLGFLGPGADRVLVLGDSLGPGHFELRDRESGACRIFAGKLEQKDKGLFLDLPKREYAAGVIYAETPKAGRALRVELGAAVLRFLACGARHAGADVCDSTHCAWFTGRGPKLQWASRTKAGPIEGNPELALPVSEEEWAEMRQTAARPGPCHWSGHCGGHPLSPHAVWGNGDRIVQSCPCHFSPSALWHRFWPAEAVRKALGFNAAEQGLDLAIRWPEGVWTLVIRCGIRSQTFSFDQVHRKLAAVLGWDALPSPASEILPDKNGFSVRGVGAGHRVGLCLGEGERPGDEGRVQGGLF